MSRLKNTFILLLFLVSGNVFAQENLIKIGFSDAFLGNYNFNFERVLNDKNSVQLKVGYWAPTSSVFISEATITPDPFELQEASGGLSTSLEYRFYVTSQSAPYGFYVAPYFRFFNQTAVFTDEIDGHYFDVDGQLNSFGVGGQIGYQFIFNETITVDLYFFGAGIDRHGAKFKYTLQEPQPGFDYNSITDDVSEVFEDINYFEKRLKHEVNDDNLTSKLPFLFPGFRLGVNVGIAF
ncbi:MAG: DUF3575 domain-containing protein [Prolixibacteraceae bacterium]|nr:DUF3575 domain-containing protein [Prolixibacteraceae bacterium]